MAKNNIEAFVNDRLHRIAFFNLQVKIFAGLKETETADIPKYLWVCDEWSKRYRCTKTNASCNRTFILLIWIWKSCLLLLTLLFLANTMQFHKNYNKLHYRLTSSRLGTTVEVLSLQFISLKSLLSYNFD